MNTSQIKSYAPKARRDFIQVVTARANMLGLSESKIIPAEIKGEVAIIEGRAYPKSIAASREKIIERINSEGFINVIEKTAYTWFNRIVALRYMELHDYLNHGYRALSNRTDSNVPEILEKATEIELPGLNKDKVIELRLAGNKDNELFRMLLVAQCNALHKAMPFLFEHIYDETELLLPDNLLHSDSIIRKLVKEIDEDTWNEVEIIGWLYQFYISEKKDLVIGKVVKSEDIPAPTQLFTPNWIVKYMVQNSLGAQWLATYPHSPLKGQMKYYIEPAEQTDEVKAQLAGITPSMLNSEELTLIDPATGSGHILVEAYELFKAIYLERGYRQRDVAQLIFEKNLFGLDIDEQAVQLTGFALMMKGRADDRRLFERGVKLNLMALVDSSGFDADGLAKGVGLGDYGLKLGDLTELKRLFEHATTFGSLIQVPDGLAKKLPELKQLSEATSQNMFVAKEIELLGPLVHQAELLAAQYDAVVANPPYIGRKYQLPILKKYLKKSYEGYEKDLFSAFIARNLAFSRPHGRLGFMSPQVWMFISSYEELRVRLITRETITSLVQPEYNAFWDSAHVSICSFSIQNSHVTGYDGTFIRLTDFMGADVQPLKTLEAIRNPYCGWLYRSKQDDYEKIPGSPIAYWVSERVREVFERGTPLGELVHARQGMATADNDQFLRRWSEVDGARSYYVAHSSAAASQSPARWFPYNKGGYFRKWYGNQEFVVNWENNGRDLHAFKPRSVIRNPDYYFLPSVSWSDITSGPSSFRLYDIGFIHDVAGMSAFNFHGLERNILAAFCNTPIVLAIARVINPTVHFQIGDFVNIPFLAAAVRDVSSTVNNNVELIVSTAKSDWDAYERSWDFQYLPILTTHSDATPTLETSYTTWITQNRDTIAEMKCLEEENNRLFIDAYGLADEFNPDVPIEQITLTVNPVYRYGCKLTEEELSTRFRQDTMEELVSYAIGCMMGRYSLDEPGLIYASNGNEGFDHSRYKTFPADGDGIVPVSDIAWFEDDATIRFAEFLKVAWNEDTIGENLDFVAESVGQKSGESSIDAIRRYIFTGFFKDHLETYKKRPIYWLFSSGKQKSFECLVYLHRYNESTLARMRSTYVTPLYGKLNARIEYLRNEIEAETTTSAKKKLEKQLELFKKKHEELVKFDDELRHYADMRIRLDLDDGVKINYGKFGKLLAEKNAVVGKKKE